MKNNYLFKCLIVYIYQYRYFFREIMKNNRKKLLRRLNENNSLTVKNKNNWIKNFIKLTYAFPELIEVGEAFVDSEITILNDNVVGENDIIGICVVKNDLIKIKKFVEHHRTLGVDKFVILDNDSTDGTVEWLSKQNDVILMQTKIPYTTNKREGWINRILAHYGYDRWYFVADSDELLDFYGSESHSIKDFIKILEKKNIKRAMAIMVDMYAKSNYYEKGNIEEFYDKCIYFDTETYYRSKRIFLDLVCGGPRERIFLETPWLTKYPLFYLDKKTIECKSHFLFPLRANFSGDCNLVLKHYKFQPGELNKYREIVKSGNYFNGSQQYKNYLKILENNKVLDFFCKSTIKYNNSETLLKINLYNKIEWDEE